MASKSRIGDILTRANVIDELQLRSALAQQDQWGGRIARIVVDMGLADEDTVTEAISKATSTPRTRLGNLSRDPGALAKLDVTWAEQKGVFPFALKENGKLLMAAVADPTDLDLIDQLQMKVRARVQTFVAGEREIERAINKYYRNIESPLGAPPASRRPAVDASSTDEEEEFKIVDMSGKTVMKRIADIVSPEEAKKLEAADAPSASSAGDLLDQILSGGPAARAQLTPEEEQRLEAVQVNQEKSSKILRALLELLLEKSAFTQKELAARMKG